jgi:hypothetical protein
MQGSIETYHEPQIVISGEDKDQLYDMLNPNTRLLGIDNNLDYSNYGVNGNSLDSTSPSTSILISFVLGWSYLLTLRSSI